MEMKFHQWILFDAHLRIIGFRLELERLGKFSRKPYQHSAKGHISGRNNKLSFLCCPTVYSQQEHLICERTSVVRALSQRRCTDKHWLHFCW